MSPERSRARIWAGVGALTVAALILRIVAERRGALTGDELYSVRIVEFGSLRDAWDALRATESTPPLFYALSWLLAKVFPVDIAVRLPSLVLGALTVPVVYALGRRLFDERVALAAAVLMTVAPSALYFSVEGRAYGAMTFLVAASTLALLHALDRPSRGAWAVYVLVATAALYTHYSAVFVVGAQALWALYHAPASRRSVVLAHVVVLLLYLPWLPFLRSTSLLDAIGVLRPLNARVFFEETTQLISSAGEVGRETILGPLRWLLAAAALAAFAGAALVASKRDRERSDPLLLVAGLTVATPLGVLVASKVGTDIYVARNLLASLPALVLLLAAGAFSLPPRWAGPAVVAAIAAALLFGSVRSLDDSHRRPPFREAARVIHARVGAGDLAVVLNPYPNAAPITRETIVLQLSTPLDGHPRTVEVGRERLGQPPLLAAPGHRVFVLSGGNIPPPATGPGYRLESVRHFDGRVPLTLFTYIVSP